MTMQVKRLQDGSETWNTAGNCTSAEIKYLVLDPSNKAEAVRAILDAAPQDYGGLPLKEVRFEQYGAGGEIELSAVYSAEESSFDYSTEDEATESFDCGGGTKHMTHAISQKRVYGGTDDDAGGGIGWNGKIGSEAEFSGVDVPTADMRETYTKTISRSKATSTGYKKRVASLVGKVNNSSFKGWSPGEIMFIGCSYSTPVKGASKVTVTFNFRIMPNESNAKIANINVGSKQGFEYLWARSKTVKGTDGKPKVEVQSAYKSVVCETGNFSELGI